ncbi:MAG: LAGLIDADG family homing endonuclease [Patescibacteria group bacterium]|nr:LAGLIDADG family homing endonuclease [Patescibacteria group bacterium]
MGLAKILVSKKLLQKLYIQDNLTPFQIGEKIGCSFKTIRNRLKEHGIPFKDPAYARMIYNKKDFDGTFCEKAYMIGFRIGDLNVYKKSPDSYTIVVRCHTTQKQQVDVMKSLFDRFGQVTVSLNKGHFHVNCFMNKSFSFLIKKDDSVWKWIKSTYDNVAFNFIAGYTDAEGNFIINQGRARFKIDSYDVSLLKWISRWLKQKGIHNKLRIIYKKGEKVPNQSPFPKDLWRLNINDMNALRIFLVEIIPLLRHEHRLFQAKESLSNINKRKKIYA